jgi:predicted nucleotidyltransferase
MIYGLVEKIQDQIARLPKELEPWEVAYLLKESSIDYPQKDLDLTIWDKTEDGLYKLKASIKEQILDVINIYPLYDLRPIIEEVRIIGSICTNLYTNESDIDVHLILKPDVKLDLEDLQVEVKRWSRNNPIYIEEHPIELYIQLNPAQDLLSGGVYNIMKDEWLKGPTLEDSSYDPYEVFNGILDTVQELAIEADISLGELRRDVIDYSIIRNAFGQLPFEYREKLKDKLQHKVEEIEDSINELLKDKKEWIAMRKTSSQPRSEKEALYDVELSKRWGNANATFKFLNRYNYIKVISQLEQMMKDDNIDTEEMDDIKNLLGVNNGK